jgi:hypothetical protein
MNCLYTTLFFNIVANNIQSPLTPELNPSEQGCLPEFFTGDLNVIAYS